MLHYGKAESRTTRFARAGFVDAVESLEYALLMLIFYSYSVVGDRERRMRRIGRNRHFHVSAVTIVFHAVFDEIFDEFYRVFLFHSDDSVAVYGYLHVLLGGNGRKAFFHAAIRVRSNRAYL